MRSGQSRQEALTDRRIRHPRPGRGALLLANRSAIVEGFNHAARELGCPRAGLSPPDGRTYPLRDRVVTLLPRAGAPGHLLARTGCRRGPEDCLLYDCCSRALVNAPCDLRRKNSPSPRCLRPRPTPVTTTRDAYHQWYAGACGRLPMPMSYYERRRAEEMKDPEFRAEYERARAEIAQVDAIMRQLDSLRIAAGCSKAELARRIGRNPSTVRRLFTAEVNPELKTVATIASRGRRSLGDRVRGTRASSRRGS